MSLPSPPPILRGRGKQCRIIATHYPPVDFFERHAPPELLGPLWALEARTNPRLREETGRFRTNWDLSAARAISVVRSLIDKGVSPERLVAAGFGEFRPLDLEENEEAFARNRRIELKLTQR